MKTTFAVVLFAVMLFAAGAAEVFFVPGWRTGYTPRTGSVRIINYIYPGMPVSVKSWDSAVPYPLAVQNSGMYTIKLLDEILSMPETRRRELVIIGHSIGAKIVLDVLCVLAEKHLQIKEAVLLGGAFPYDDRRLWSALEAVRDRCINIWSPVDAVLHLLYPLSEGNVACGAVGWRFGGKGFYEGYVKSGYFFFNQHYAYLYLEELGRFRLTLPPVAEKVQLKDELPRPWKNCAVDRIFWKTIDICHSWRLEEHCLGGSFRIADPEDNQRFAGVDPVAAKKNFDFIRKQLTR